MPRAIAEIWCHSAKKVSLETKTLIRMGLLNTLSEALGLSASAAEGGNL